MRYLIDTNIVSELRKGARCHPHVATWFGTVEDDDLGLRSIPVVDGLLAATARVHGLTLVTRNVRDVAWTDVACLDPFQAGESRLRPRGLLGRMATLRACLGVEAAPRQEVDAAPRLL